MRRWTGMRRLPLLGGLVVALATVLRRRRSRDDGDQWSQATTPPDLR